MSSKKSKRDQFELDLFRAKTERLDKLVGHVAGFGRILVGGGVLTFLIYTVDSYLENEPAQISAVAKVIEALKLQFVIPALTGIVGIAAAMSERKGKQRAIRKVGEFRKRLEAEDPNRTSSGLTPEGTTPRDED